MFSRAFRGACSCFCRIVRAAFAHYVWQSRNWSQARGLSISGYITTSLKLCQQLELERPTTEHRTTEPFICPITHTPLSQPAASSPHLHMTTPHKVRKGRKSQVTFSSTTTTIPPRNMSYYPQQHQYQSPQTYAHGQMPTYQPQSTCTYGVYSPRVRLQLSPTLGSGYDYYNAHSGYGNRYVGLTTLVYGS